MTGRDWRAFFAAGRLEGRRGRRQGRAGSQPEPRIRERERTRTDGGRKAKRGRERAAGGGTLGTRENSGKESSELGKARKRRGGQTAACEKMGAEKSGELAATRPGRPRVKARGAAKRGESIRREGKERRAGLPKSAGAEGGRQGGCAKRQRRRGA